MNNFLENVNVIENPFPLSVTYKPIFISEGKILPKVKLSIPLDNMMENETVWVARMGNETAWTDFLESETTFKPWMKNEMARMVWAEDKMKAIIIKPAG